MYRAMYCAMYCALLQVPISDPAHELYSFRLGWGALTSMVDLVQALVEHPLWQGLVDRMSDLSGAPLRCAL